MKMEEMLGFLRREGFVAVKQYDPNAHVYVFTITKDGVTVTDDFKYPAGKDFALRDRLQREFMSNLMTVWENRKFYSRFKDKKGEASMAKHEWMDPETGKKYGYSWGYDIEEKGESKMRKIDNLMRDLAINNNKARLVYGNDIYDIVVRDAMTDCRPGETSNIIITCDLVADGFATYARKDVEMTSFLAKRMNIPYGSLPKIKDVIFNPPATIVFWADNTKTVVKCQEGDDFDAEKGLTMAITKKLFGNKGNYFEEIKKWVKKYKPEPVEIRMNGFSLTELDKMIREALGLPTEKKEEPIVAETPETADPEKRWKIWWKKYDAYGKVVGSGVHHMDYDDKTSALIVANKLFANMLDFEYSWVVSQDNPWEKD